MDDIVKAAAKPAADVLLVDFVEERGLKAWERAAFALACRGLGERAPLAKLEQLLTDTLHGRI